MKSCFFAFICLLAVPAFVSNAAYAGCPRCDKGCSQCDDRGLLDTADRLFGSLHAHAKFALSGVPRSGSSSCDRCRGCDAKSRPSCGCEAKPNRGSYRSAPSCGCEAAPSCGCEISWQGSQSSHAALHPKPPRTQVVTPDQYRGPSKPTAIIVPPRANDGSPEPIFPLPEKEPFSPAPVPPGMSPRSLPETRPAVPDREIDPFMDDSASRVRKVPAKTIQHRQEKSQYGDHYDPQANRSRLRSLHHASTNELRSTSSSRNTAVRMAFHDRDSSATPVVTASGSRPRRITSSQAKRLPSAPEVLVNPLRQ